MIRAEIPQNVTDYKEELFFGLTLRKLISVIIVLIIVVPIYVIGKNFVDTSILIYIAIIPCVPVVLVGFKEIEGMPFEQYAKLIWDFYTKEQRRTFKYVPYQEEFSEEINKVLLSGEKILRKEELRMKKRIEKSKKKAGKGE